MDHRSLPVMRFADVTKYVVEKKTPPTLPAKSKSSKSKKSIQRSNAEGDTDEEDQADDEDSEIDDDAEDLDDLSDDENEEDDRELAEALAAANTSHLETDLGVFLESSAAPLRDLLSDKPTTDILRPSEKRAAGAVKATSASKVPTFDLSKPLKWT